MPICRTDHHYFPDETQLLGLHKKEKIYRFSLFVSSQKNEQKDFKDNCNSSLPVDGGYPLVRPLNAPIEETDDAAEVALPNWVADPE